MQNWVNKEEEFYLKSHLAPVRACSPDSCGSFGGMSLQTVVLCPG